MNQISHPHFLLYSPYFYFPPCSATAPPFPTAPPPNLFLLTTLNPAPNKTNASTPKITANVTIAPITPATALDIPPLFSAEPESEPEEEEEEEAVVSAQAPVELPHAAHQSTWSPMANLFISSTNVVYGKVISVWLKSG